MIADKNDQPGFYKNIKPGFNTGLYYMDGLVSTMGTKFPTQY